jgi:[ribosomal protein S5]-alanine N-acetyltransferase
MIQTERLDLREFTIADFDAIHAYASDPLVTLYTSFGPNTFEQTQDFLTRTIKDYAESPRRSHVFGIVDRDSGTLFGSGYGSEAATALVEFGFEELDAHRLWAHVFVGNVASARILEGLGFRQEGIAVQSLYVRNAWHDIITYARLGSE